jgi:hypothetical protein
VSRLTSLGDEAMAQQLARSLRLLEPDALFRRRLRGAILNRYVATREGLVQEPGQRRGMGVLARGVLYASLAVALSVSAAGAAAAASLPGDLLYPVKLQLEDVRLQVASPSTRADLLAMALEERLDELEQLAANGDWAEVAVAAQGVAAAEERLAVAAVDPQQVVVDAISQHTAVLEVLITAAPTSARQGLEQAIQASSAADEPRSVGAEHRVRPPAAPPPTQPAGEERQLPAQREPKPAS